MGFCVKFTDNVVFVGLHYGYIVELHGFRAERPNS